MATAAEHAQIASAARRRYIDELLKGLPGLVQSTLEGARQLLDKPAEHGVAQRRRDLVGGLQKHASAWHGALTAGLRHVAQHGATVTLPSDMPSASAGGGLSLVDNDTIEREILTSRLALAIMDRASWEFTDLRSRIAMLERRGELDTHDMLRAHILARVALDAWRQVGLDAGDWREAQAVLHDEFSALAEEAYHETNRYLVGQRVMHEIDLRPFIRRTRDAGVHGGATSGFGAMDPTARGGAPHDTGGRGFGRTGATGGGADHGTVPGAFGPMGEAPMPRGRARGQLPTPVGGAARSARDQVGEETRLMTRAAPLARGADHAEAVLGRLNRLVARHLPGFNDPQTAPRGVPPALSNAIAQAQQNLRRRFAAAGVQVDGVAAPPRAGAGSTVHEATRLEPRLLGPGQPLSAPVMLEELQRQKQALKQAAATPAERATIEIVAMMFQSILTEERIPAAVRVWFARLQMPVLRVAITEPDFFATLDHPARRLIDRMGACVMGLDAAPGAIGDALEKEVKRVVQVVEAYPDTGRRVFQTVLTEFEKFLEHYFRHENESTKKGVSLAQKLEQRETLAIQYTIELRRMLAEVPVQEGIREFLFQVWADVLATCAVRDGAQSAETKAMKRVAADLIWSAAAKVTRDERAEVIRRLPPLMKRLRDGMAGANMSAEKQEERIAALNSALAAAFTAKAAVIPPERLQDLTQRLDTLEELLPAAEDIEIDESMVFDLSGHETSELEVVADGGSLPTPPMVAWARELLVGSWYRLEWRGRRDNVQLVWQGMRRQLSLFATPTGRCLLFQQQRLAAYLQAGLLLPVQDEALTVRATRNALAKLDADPSRLMN